MCFEHLYDATKRNELILLDGAMCHWHLRKDGQITIREIISQVPGKGTEILNILKSKNPSSIYAKCPDDLPSNKWYEHLGFVLESVEYSKSGRKINCWRLYNEYSKDNNMLWREQESL